MAEKCQKNSARRAGSSLYQTLVLWARVPGANIRAVMPSSSVAAMSAPACSSRWIAAVRRGPANADWLSAEVCVRPRLVLFSRNPQDTQGGMSRITVPDTMAKFQRWTHFLKVVCNTCQCDVVYFSASVSAPSPSDHDNTPLSYKNKAPKSIE